MGQSNSQYKTNPEDVTNEEFLRAIFGPLYSNVWVGCATKPKGDFATKLLRWLNPTTSCWFAVATINGGAGERSNSTAEAGVVVIMDDIGTKFTEEFRLPKPTYKIETSPNNYQWGYVLKTPETNMQKWGAFRELLKKSKFAGASDGSGLAHYVRLPNGGYHKDEHLPEEERFDTLMTEWNPFTRYEFDELAKLLGIELTEDIIAGIKVSQDAATVASNEELQNDPGYKMFEHLGWIKSAQKEGGWIDVQCPQEELHTGNISTGSAYAIKAGSNRTPDFKCHHQHCQGLRWQDGVEKIFWNDPRYRDAYRKLVFDLIPEESDQSEEAKAFRARMDELTADKEQENNVLTLMAEYLPPEAKKYRRPDKFKLERFDATDTSPLYKRPVIVQSFMRNDMMALTADPGQGKSTYALHLALAIAWEDTTPIIAHLEGEEAAESIRFPGDIIIVANEDSATEIKLRLKAAIRYHNLDPQKQKHQIHFVARSGVKLIGVDPKTGQVKVRCQQLLRSILGVLETDRRPQIAMIQFDTLSSSLGEGVKESDTSTMQMVMNYGVQLAESLFASIVLIHHSSKVGSKQANPSHYDVLRGSSTIAGSIRSGLAVLPLQKEDWKRFGLKTEKDAAPYIKIVSIKNNYGAKTGGAVGFYKMVSVDEQVRDPITDAPLTESVGVLQPVLPLVVTQTDRILEKWEALKTARDALPPGAIILAENVSKNAPPGSVTLRDLVRAAGLGKPRSKEDARAAVREVIDGGFGKYDHTYLGDKHATEIVIIFDEPAGVFEEIDEDSEDIGDEYNPNDLGDGIELF